MQVNVHFVDMNYIIHTEVARMGAYDIFASFGGILGLFLGMSILSLFEILEFVLNLILRF